MANQQPQSARRPAVPEPTVDVLDESDCLRLIAGGGVGRIGYTGRYGPTILPVNYQLAGETIVFRTGLHSSLEEDLQTGIPAAEYKVAFEIDQIKADTEEGWSVLVQGSAHRVQTDTEFAWAAGLGVHAWAAGPKEQFLCIRPTRFTGRRIRRTSAPQAT